MTPEDFNDERPRVYDMAQTPEEREVRMGDIFSIASSALETAQEETRKWRMRAEDAEINMREALLQLKHFRRMAEIHDQIIEQKSQAIDAYKNMVEDLQGGGMVGRQSEEILALQKKLKFALAYVPRGNAEMFYFLDGDEADYGSQAQYTELQLDYFCQALPLAMSCINRMHAQIDGGRETLNQLIQACKHSLEKVHERTQAGDEICPFSGQMRTRNTWLQEKDDD